MPVNGKAYWAWLQLALGAGSFKPKRLLEYYPCVQAFYEAGQTEWRSLGLFTPKELKLLADTSLEDGQALLYASEQGGLQTITPDCKAYPDLLRELENPPSVLYVLGTLPDVDRLPALAVVGTRNATTTGKQIAFDLSMQMAQAGMVIVSGGAKGIDTAAHQGALRGDGPCICVLGCGIGYRYLMENESIRNAVVKQGAIVSEFPLNMPPMKQNFPIRNRIISGLSVGVLVVEAAERSGSLITARTALEQNRDVFAVPCGIYNPVSEGVNNLLKAGAKPVTKPQDILEEYEERYRLLSSGRQPIKKIVHKKPEDPLFYEEQRFTGVKSGNEDHSVSKEMQTEVFSEDGDLLYRQLTKQPLHIAELEELTGLSTQRILTAITELELCGAITSYSGRRYSLPNDILN